MQEYRIKGLSCSNCANMLEQKIQKLPHGASAKLNYNLGKLILDPKVPLEQVEKILKSDGAYIVQEEQLNQHGDAKDDHNQNKRVLPLLIVSSALFVLALGLDFVVHSSYLIPIYLTVILISGYTTFTRGLKNLTQLIFNIDTLMTVALIGAVAIGEWKEATLVAILFGLNEWLESLGMDKARRSMETLLNVAPKEAVKMEGGREVIVPIESLQSGNIVKVKPGEKIPSDGTILEGTSAVNEAAITGESLPVDKKAGEKVYGGSINQEGLLIIQIDKPYKDSSLAKILRLIQEAQETKTPTELFINRFAKYYTPIIIVIAAFVIIVPPLFFGGTWLDWLYQGLAVLIVGCPCALILSSPLAILAAITRNARNGILVKGGIHMEQLGKINLVAIDKTGTLTVGKPQVVKTVVWMDDKDKFFAIVAAMERNSTHPLASAMIDEIDRIGLVSHLEAKNVQILPGAGMTAWVDGKKYYIGNEKTVGHLRIPETIQMEIDRFKQEGLTLVLIANNTHLLGMFGIADKIREESAEVIASLHKQGIQETIMLTGDHEQSAKRVAKAVGVSSYFSNLLPEEKVEIVKNLTEKGKVAMIGDGINDAPALASATLGIAMGKGTDSAIETADVVLMQDHLGKLPNAIAISKKMNNIIQFNIAVALGLKLIALLLTIPGWLTLWFAILSDMGATIFVTLISLTLLIQRPEDRMAALKMHTPENM